MVPPSFRSSVGLTLKSRTSKQYPSATSSSSCSWTISSQCFPSCFPRWKPSRSRNVVRSLIVSSSSSRRRQRSSISTRRDPLQVSTVSSRHVTCLNWWHSFPARELVQLEERPGRRAERKIYSFEAKCRSCYHRRRQGTAAPRR